MNATETGKTTKAAKGKSKTPAAKKTKPDQPAEPKSARKRSEPRGPTRQQRLIEMLRRENGVTIDELMAEFGWQAHSARGAGSQAILT